MEEEKEIITVEEERYLSVAQVKDHVSLINNILKSILVEGIVKNGKIVKDGHYSKLPGCGERLVLLKPGAEKLCLAFNLVPRYNINILPALENEHTPPGHRDYEVTCELFNRHTGNFVGQGMGSCTTLETKYKYRTKWANNKPIKEPNPCIADVYNTVKKMACKRALVHAVIQCLAVGDIFMQDVEDMKPEDLGNGQTKPPMEPPTAKSDKEASQSKTGEEKKKNNIIAIRMHADKLYEGATDLVKHNEVGNLLGIKGLEHYNDLTLAQTMRAVKILKENADK